jgi:hypothetical protein
VDDALVAVDAGLLAREQEGWWATEARGDCFVMSIESVLWQLRHSRESLALKRAHSCSASSSRLSVGRRVRCSFSRAAELHAAGQQSARD